MTTVGEQQAARGDSEARKDGEGEREGVREGGSAGVQETQNSKPRTQNPPLSTELSPQHSTLSPRKKRHGPPKQAFVLLALLLGAGIWWGYTELTYVPPVGIAASGTIESEEVSIASEMAGRAVQIYANEGDRVREGQLLVKLDDSVLQLQYRMAASAAERQLLEMQIGKTSIHAPMSGVVARRSLRLGEVVSPGATLMVVGETDPVELTLYVPEREIGRVKVGQKVDVRVDSFPSDSFPGEVTFISTRAEFTPRNVQTQKDRMNLVFAVKVRIPNADGRLKPGMPADATIVTGDGR